MSRKNGREVKIVKMTPDRAQRLLDASEETRVRAVREGRVRLYLKEIANGDWSITGQGITLDKSGKVIDGHHRLTAIARSKKPVEIVVLTGAEPKDVYKVDEGAPRVLADFIRQMGKQYHIVLASAVRNLWLIRHKQLGVPRVNQKNPASMENYLTTMRSAGKKLEESVAFIAGLPVQVRGIASVGLQSVLHYKGKMAWGESEVMEWFEGLRTGENLDEHDPIRRLREMNFRELRQGASSRPSSRMRIARYVKAWNYWVKGQEVQQLSVRLVGKSREPFPQPIFDSPEYE